MGRLRLTPDGEERVVGWAETAAREDRDRLAEFVETLADGSWETRWWWRPYPADRSITEVRPDEGLIVHMRVVLDEVDGAMCADVLWVHRDPERTPVLDGDLPYPGEV